MEFLTAQRQQENNLMKQKYIEKEYNNSGDKMRSSNQNVGRVEYEFYSPQNDITFQKPTTTKAKGANSTANSDIDRLIWNGIQLGLFFLTV